MWIYTTILSPCNSKLIVIPHEQQDVVAKIDNKIFYFVYVMLVYISNIFFSGLEKLKKRYSWLSSTIHRKATYFIIVSNFKIPVKGKSLRKGKYSTHNPLINDASPMLGKKNPEHIPGLAFNSKALKKILVKAGQYQ